MNIKVGEQWTAAQFQDLENLLCGLESEHISSLLRVLRWSSFDYWPTITQKDADVIAEIEASRVFVESFANMGKGVHANSVAHGWWEGDRNIGEALALIHSEVSEALEAARSGNPLDDKIPEFSGLEAELADVVIRVMDLGAGLGLRIGEAIHAKHEYNKTREYKHGGKEF